MFILSKILGLLTQSLNWVIGLLLLGLLLQKHKPIMAKKLLWSALALLLLQGWQPAPDWVMHQLESRYPEYAPSANLGPFVGMVVLGGATESGRVSQAHAQPLFNGAGERLTAPIAAVLHNPHLKVIYTGGEGALWGSGPSEADRARIFFESLGLPAQRVQYEAASRNTYENAVLSAQLPGVDITQRWLLVTSAAHMPRSMLTFAKAGWNVTAYPVDFRTAGTIDWSNYTQRDGERHWDQVLYELVGIAAYKITGRL
jgi:uncharacterized SAM-binding protein YcdF (DUF218 family)